MARGKKHSAEQVVNLLRQIEVGVANGKTTAVACKEAEITEQTYYRWRKEYGGLQVDQARRLKELEQENAKLKRLVANLSLEKLVLKDIASGKHYKPGNDGAVRRSCAGHGPGEQRACQLVNQPRGHQRHHEHSGG